MPIVELPLRYWCAIKMVWSPCFIMPFPRNWKKIADTTKLKQITDQKGLDDYSHIPTMKRNKLKMRRENREAVLQISYRQNITE